MAATADAITALESQFGNRLSTNPAVRDQHARGEGSFAPAPPDAVVFPHTTQEVAQAVRICGEHRVPIIPFGAGSSLEGQVRAVHGGVSINLSEMTRMLSVSPEDLDCRVEAGVTREALNHELRDQGLFFPLDPGYNASLGGMAATRCSGTNAVRYGTMKEVVLGTTAVLADGSIIRTGGRARKSAAGYDLTSLLVGSEGTLGIITELQLRLFGIPEEIASAVVQFADLEGAVNAVIALIQMSVPVARIELLDALQMRACKAWSALDKFDEAPTLFLEFHGSPVSVEDQVKTTAEVFADFGAGDFRWSNETEERNRLWKARHEAYHAGRGLKPGWSSIATDACVPISRLADNILKARQMADEAGLVCPIVGHVGDGNFHALILYDEADVAMTKSAKDLSNEIARNAIKAGGTCTGEHGIGTGKKDLLREEHGSSVAVMAKLKQSLDPHNILNPGKIF